MNGLDNNAGHVVCWTRSAVSCRLCALEGRSGVRISAARRRGLEVAPNLPREATQLGEGSAMALRCKTLRYLISSWPHSDNGTARSDYCGRSSRPDRPASSFTRPEGYSIDSSIRDNVALPWRGPCCQAGLEGLALAARVRSAVGRATWSRGKLHARWLRNISRQLFFTSKKKKR